MNSKVIAIVVVLIILLGLGGIFLYSKSSKSVAPVKTAQITQTPAKSQNTFNNTTLAGLIALGQNLRCTFSVTGTNGDTTNGTFYVSKANVRGDFTIKTTDGKQNQVSMIRIGDTNYIWGSALPSGIKMTLSLDKIRQSAQVSQYQAVTQKTNYSCLPWNVDASLFTPPANIKFTDVTSMIPVSPTGTQTQTQTTGSVDPCAAITNATAKTACENALKQQNGQ